MENLILEINFSFIGHDGTRQAVTISEHGIKFSDSHRLATQELIFIARLADLMREFFHYKFNLLHKQKATTDEHGAKMPVTPPAMVH